MFDTIIAYFENISPIKAALIAGLFTWFLTVLGASVVFLFKKMNQVFLDGMLGFTGGVMIAASYFSLLAPAIAMSNGEGFIKIIPASVGFLIGALFLFGLDKILPHLHINFKEKEKDVIDKSAKLYRNRLKTVFDFVSQPYPLKNSLNTIMYHLFLASNNDTAVKIGNDLVKKYNK